jgi:hypothetical protein
MSETGTKSLTIAELREFASFSACEQRYIRRSLDIGLARQDALRLWARNAGEAASIRNQYAVYRELAELRGAVPSETALEPLAAFIGKLIRIAAFDLAQERLATFSAFRFLYERLLGPDVRPFLPSAFCAAAALPQIRPDRRKNLLQSISEAAATAPGWSLRPPCFFPEWVEKEAA